MSDRLEAAIRELVAAIREEIRQEAETKPRPSALLSVADAAAQLSIGRSLAYDAIQRGHLRTVKVGRRRLVPEDALADFVRLAGIGLDRAGTWMPPQRRPAPRKGAVRMRFPPIGRTDRAFVLDRDNWECRLCGKPIEPERTYPDPLSASIDHIDPRGRHEPSNWQAAHLRCNVQKGDKHPPAPMLQ